MSDSHHDDWFKHTSEEGAAQEAHGRVNAPFIIAFLLMVIAITFTLIFIIIGYVGREVAGEKGEKFESRTEIIAREHFDARTRWNTELEGDPRWVDLESRTVRIPIEYAAREVVESYRRAQNPGN